jgi:periplasmic divalent cation tolerance protein
MSDDPDYVQISWTAATLEEAREVSSYLVREGLVACANIIPSIESIFLWKGLLEKAQEAKVIFKTRSERFSEVKKCILEKSSYEVPEILKLPILGGHDAYLAWIDQVVK